MCSQLDGLARARAGRLSFVAALSGVSIGRGPEFVVARTRAEIVFLALPNLVCCGFADFKRHAANRIGDLHIGTLLFNKKHDRRGDHLSYDAMITPPVFCPSRVARRTVRFSRTARYPVCPDFRILPVREGEERARLREGQRELPWLSA